MKVISGGQTGADRTALEVARELGIQTGGFAPKGWRTDEGPDPSLKDFGLVESAFPTYRPRTRANAKHSDGTVWFGHTGSPGHAVTARACTDYMKPFLENPTAEALTAWIRAQEIEILNVAGNRRLTNPGVCDLVRSILTPALEALRGAPNPVDSTPEEEISETQEAIAAVVANTDEDWAAFMDARGHDVAEEQILLTSESIWVKARARGHWPTVHDNKAMAGVMLRGKAAGWWEKADHTENAKRMGHGRHLTVWRSLIYKGSDGGDPEGPVPGEGTVPPLATGEKRKRDDDEWDDEET